MDRLATIIESMPWVHQFSVRPGTHRDILTEIVYSTHFGRHLRTWCAIGRGAAADINALTLRRLLDGSRSDFLREFTDEIEDNLRKLQCGHQDATTDELRELLPCAACTGVNAWIVPDPEMNLRWNAPMDDTFTRIRFRRERFVFGDSEVWRWEREA